MTPRRAAGVSFSLLLVATVVAWRLTAPGAPDRTGPAGSSGTTGSKAVLASDTRAALAGASRAASRRRRPHSRPTTRAGDVAARAGPVVITGRVVTHGDHEPAPGANVKVMWSDEDGPVMAAHVAADREGKFSIPLPGPEPETVAIEISSENGFGKEDYHVFGPYQGIVDVGDVELSTMNIVWFHVQAPDGAPVAGALAHPRPGGTFVARADAEGNGQIESNVAMKSIRFVAPGFELADVPVPPGQDSLKVVLQPGISLTIQVTTPAGPPMPESTWVSVDSDQFPCAIEPGDPLWQALENTNLAGRSGRTRLGDPVAGRSGESWSFRAGTIRLAPIRSGTRLSIWASPDLRARLVEQEVVLSAPESRVVELALPGTFGRLRGRVVDSSGAPVAGASVFMGRKDFERLTADDGAFDFGAVPAGKCDVRVSSLKHAQWRRPAHDVLVDSEPLVAMLETGVNVTVKVVDADGRPVRGASVSALDRYRATDEEGQIVLTHLTPGLVNIGVIFQGTREVVQHDTATPTVTITLPGSGR